MPPTDAHERSDAGRPKPLQKKPTLTTKRPRRTKSPQQILDTLERTGSVYLPSSQAASILPGLKKSIEARLPGRRVTYEGNRLKVHQIERKSGGFFGGVPEWVRNVPGDIPQIATGFAGMAADYGEAGVLDVKDLVTAANARALARGDFGDINLPFARSGRLARRDILGSIGAIETAIPEPSFLPEWMRKEVISVDPRRGRIGRGSGRIDPRDVERARTFWREDPLIAAASVAPLIGTVTRAVSVGALRRSLARANPGVPMRTIRKIASKESKMPGYAAAHGYEGGMAPRLLAGEYGVAPARHWSRSPEGRALQRFYDRASRQVERRKPDLKFSTSQRAQRHLERLDRRAKQQADLEADLMERTVYKAAGRDKAKREALTAALEGPRGVTPRQAVEMRLADLRETPTAAIESQRSQIRMQLDNRIAALEKALEGDWLESPKVSSALDEMESVSGYLDEQYKTLYPDETGLAETDALLAARRNKLVDRYAKRGLLPDGVEPEARGYFPHRDIFEDLGTGRGGSVVAAKSNVVGVPRRSQWATRQANKLARYEAGRVQGDPKVLASTFRNRNRLIWNIKARRDLYDNGDEFTSSDVPSNMMAVRNPDAPPTRMDTAMRAALDDPDAFAEQLTPEFLSDSQKTWLYEPGQVKPEWLFDVENVRLVPKSLVRTRMADVFPSAPQGLQATVAATMGTLNSLARFVTIYTPYGGARYVLRNTPQNMILLALTQPGAFRNVPEAVWGLRKDMPLKRSIEIETGSVPAAAGLPDLAGRRIGKVQKVEAGTTWAARKTAQALGEISDQPWRIASWIEYAKAYGYKKQKDWRRLLDSDDPAVIQVRNDISQRVREDMIDFDSLSPVERESIARFLFIYPFVKGATKWPLIYVRERPIQTAIATLLLSQHARESEGKSVWEQGQVDIAGRPIDFGWLDLSAPSRSTFEGVGRTARAIAQIPSKGPQGVVRESSRFLSPQYREALKPWDDPIGIRRAFIPGYSTAEKLMKGGSLSDQAIRMIGSEVLPPKSKKTVEKRRQSLATDLEQIGRSEVANDPLLVQAFKRQELLAAAIEDKDSEQDKTLAALALAKRAGTITAADYRKYVAFSKKATEYENELMLGRISDHLFGGLTIAKVRSGVNDALRARKLEPTR